MNTPVLLTIGLAAVLLAGCAAPRAKAPTVESTVAQNEARKQRELVIEDYLDDYRCLLSVSSRIIVSGRELCGEDVAPYFGIDVWNIDSVSKEWRETLQSRSGLDSALQVSLVVPGTAADAAGLREGDEIVAINALLLSESGKDAPAKFMERLTAEGKYGEPVELTVRRDGEETRLAVMPEQACNFNVHLSQDSSKNAYADGKNIVIHKGMMEFTRSDEEIALVVSHELAHNAMKHIDAQKTNSIVGDLAGLLLDIAAAYGGVNTGGDFSRMGSGMGAGAYSVSFEQEADYVGLYFMTLAGYNIDDAGNFWRRMAVADPRAITMKTSHPTSPERFVAIEATVQEIHQKIADNAPLKPEMKADKAD